MDFLQERPHARHSYPEVPCIATVRQDRVYAGAGEHPNAMTPIGDVTVHFLTGLEAATLATAETGSTRQEPAP